jgi:HEAT repeat protein
MEGSMMPQKKTAIRHSAVAPKSVTPMTAAAKAAVTAAPVVEVVKPAEVAKPAVAAVATPAVASLPAFPADQVEKLRGASVEVAVEAAEVLAKTGDARAIAPLISVLENADGYCHVVTRAAAAMALGRFNDAKSIAALHIAAKDSMAEVSREAVLALGQLKATAATDTLTEIAGNASGFYVNVVRHAAVRSLGQMKAKGAKSVLETIAKNASEDAALVAAAREAIGQL